MGHNQHSLGLLQIFPSPNVSSSQSTIDIIAIHGLNTGYPTTWEAYNKDSQSNSDITNWLKDEHMLPSIIPDARIFAYNWNANTFTDTAFQGMLGHTDTLPEKIKHMRDGDTISRPLIFIASCFGGLLLAKALHRASEQSSPYQNILKSVAGIVFLGTPFKGSKALPAAQVRARVARVMGGNLSDKLLNALETDTSGLDEIVQRFSELVYSLRTQIQMCCFYETKVTNISKAVLPALLANWTRFATSVMLVEEQSACLDGVPRLPIGANHTMLNKYHNANDESFKMVSTQLKKFADMVGDTLQRKEETRPNATKNQHWLVTRSVISKFTGRTEILDTIERVLSPDNQGPASQQKRYIITGMGGIGKSEICLKVADIMRHKFWGVFWIDVETEESTALGFKAIASLLGVPSEDWNAARLELARHNEPWLLILDNGDDKTIDYSKYFPTGSFGSVLMTSRNPECGELSTVGHLELDVLNSDDAVKLLLDSANVPLESRTAYDSLARNVVTLLGSHTLAIIHAGAHIKKNFSTLETYPTIFARNRRKALEFKPSQNRSRYDTVYNTFDISAQVLVSSASETDKDAMCLLSILCMLHFGPLSTEIFQTAWEESQSRLKEDFSEFEWWQELTRWHYEQLPVFLDTTSENWDPSRLFDAVKQLHSLSLIRQDIVKGRVHLSMHPLVHFWARERQTPDSRRISWLSAGSLVAFSFQNGLYRSSGYGMHIHIQALLGTPTEQIFSMAPEKEIAIILLHCCLWLENHWETSQVENLLLKLFAQLDGVPRNLLVLFYRIQGTSLGRKLDPSGINVLEEVHHCIKDCLPEDHLEILRVQDSLATAYQNQNQLSKAIKLFEHSYQISQNTLHESHVERRNSEHNLATAYLQNNQASEGLTLLQHLAKIERTILSEDEPSLLITEHAMATAYLDAGDHREGLELLQRIVQKYQEILSEYHPWRLNSEHNLAVAYYYDNQLLEARNLMQHVVYIRQKPQIENHPGRVASEKWLSLM